MATLLSLMLTLLGKYLLLFRRHAAPSRVCLRQKWESRKCLSFNDLCKEMYLKIPHLV